jgi:pimeloyl-ACP methyl ester carboxylesterase
MFAAGACDWGIHQKPGEFESKDSRGFSRLLGCALVEGAGHWVQQERPEAVVSVLLDFLREARR